MQSAAEALDEKKTAAAANARAGTSSRKRFDQVAASPGLDNTLWFWWQFFSCRGLSIENTRIRSDTALPMTCQATAAFQKQKEVYQALSVDERRVASRLRTSGNSTIVVTVMNLPSSDLETFKSAMRRGFQPLDKICRRWSRQVVGHCDGCRTAGARGFGGAVAESRRAGGRARGVDREG